MSTYRERREARVDRLNGWAEKREAKAAALHAKGDLSEAASGIPFGQPILIGHHSERRHRNAITKARDATQRAAENSETARRMREKAATIAAQADHAIYSDDTDAADRLRARVTAQETEREEMKASNAAYRKTHAAALRAMSPFMRGQALPHPPFAMTNIAARIRRDRARLAEMEAATE